MSAIALLPAAGSGSRMGGALPKQYLDLLGKPLIWHTLHALHAVPELARIVVVLSPDDGWWDGYDWQSFARLTVLRCGGDSRAASVLGGLQALAMSEPGNSWVLVHDAARPCVDPALVSGMIAQLAEHPVGGILAVPVADTLKLADAARHIDHTHPRDQLWQAQTPQMFRLADLAGALEAGMGPDITDEASALEKLGQSPALVMGSPWNLKVTYPQDLQLAALILQARNTTA
ncbi:2-C-methyl-D-erythritol 4-phosphate cytidylyltransferase [Andreprevotia lacus DSM 23236]|jgi:2-C-methyl-D-erythritol 4-phosphate cytidylyltransferase|uniref:2-C-methyl-D-erythritol 4-phosphate cytidylyltransferase n=1 Tax=Andreprevotia lacus DSM 23236 TaxID=1121001 RepID=A0A1W1XXU5_9NEIS|nr:2-C-methyl-D-erythritol 4-phosphate cytidylyltransferase [Andreprevotia lacus]SMC28770.1 2-C-methyl-D-erythritol 4-phosphate cytidylyltransferase [Andreprevotia lacus DSM 23236]